MKPSSPAKALNDPKAKTRPLKKLATKDDLIESLLNDSLYDVRPDGTVWTRRVRGNRHVPGKAWRQVKTTPLNGAGYISVSYKNKKLLAHRIVFRKFNGPLSATLEINHLDGNKQNNCPSNLTLTDASGNMRHRFEVLRQQGTKSNSKICFEVAEQIRAEHLSGRSQKFLASKYELDQSSISLILNQHIWKEPVDNVPQSVA
jgi:hypothetical protein